MKNILLLLMLALIPIFQSFVNAKPLIDSVRFKQRKAVWDVRFFKLNKQNLEAFKKKRFEPTSDYFKPKLGNVKHPNLINDPVYTKAYLEAAFNKTKHRNTYIYYGFDLAIVTFGLTILALIYNF